MLRFNNSDIRNTYSEFNRLLEERRAIKNELKKINRRNDNEDEPFRSLNSLRSDLYDKKSSGRHNNSIKIINIEETIETTTEPAFRRRMSYNLPVAAFNEPDFCWKDYSS